MTTPGPVPNGHRPSQQAQQQAQQAAAQQQLMADHARQLAAEINAQVQQLTQANIVVIQELAAKGIRMDPGQVLNMRIEVIAAKIAEVLGPQGPVWLANCNLAYEEQMAAVLAEAKTEGAKAILGMGASMSAAAIRDLARSTRTFGG